MLHTSEDERCKKEDEEIFQRLNEGGVSTIYTKDWKGIRGCAVCGLKEHLFKNRACIGQKKHIVKTFFMK